MPRRLIRIFAWNLAATAVIAILNVPGSDGVAAFGWRVLIGFVYSNWIGTLVGLAFELTPLSLAIERRRFPFNWLLLLGVLAALAALGCALAVATLVAAGVYSYEVAAQVLRGSVFSALAITFVFGISGFVFGRINSQLERKAAAEERARQLAVEARLSSLESRIHPHFLFNTLNSIAALIREDPLRAERTVEQLAALLRFSLDSGDRRAVPLEREVRVVEQYLEIERVRFGERLRFEIDVPARLGAVEVPPLSLQTLVENAVKHAVSPSREGAAIRVVARETAGRVELEVVDDGPGFDGEIVAGHGLDNLRQRLESLYGDDASLRVDARPGRVSVAVELPARLAAVAAS
jgi:sensor histidine kinase YesM